MRCWTNSWRVSTRKFLCSHSVYCVDFGLFLCAVKWRTCPFWSMYGYGLS
jgi:hypothetical protein